MIYTRQKTRFLITILMMAFLMSSLHLRAQIPLEEVKVTDKIELLVPTTFNVLQLQDIKYKDLDPTAPLAVFSDDSRNSDLSVNITRANLGNDLPILKEFYKSNLFNLYDSVSIIDDQIMEINNREFIRLEFIGIMFAEENVLKKQGDLAMYIAIEYTPYDEKMLIFSFSTPYRQKSYWQETAKAILGKVKIKD